MDGFPHTSGTAPRFYLWNRRQSAALPPLQGLRPKYCPGIPADTAPLLCDRDNMLSAGCFMTSHPNRAAHGCSKRSSFTAGFMQVHIFLKKMEAHIINRLVNADAIRKSMSFPLKSHVCGNIWSVYFSSKSAPDTATGCTSPASQISCA